MKKLVVCGLCVFLSFSCGDPNDPGPLADEAGFVMLDRDARNTDVVLVVDDTPVRGLAPEMVDPESRIFVGAGSDGFDLRVAPGELLHLKGPDARVERLLIERDVRSDRLTVVATSEAASDLAEQVGASIEPVEPDTWQLEAPGLLQQLASADVPEGVSRIIPERIVAGSITAPAATDTAPTLATSVSGLRIEAAMLQTDPARPNERVVGRWEADDFMANQNTRYRFVLEIAPVAGDPTRIRGRIWSHFDPSNSGHGCRLAPQMVRADGVDPYRPVQLSVVMEAEGEFDGEQFSFAANSWRNAGSTMPASMGYNLDRFSGRLSTDGDSLNTVNNDGGMAVDHPVDFIRVR